jgi:hypothetical protein
LNWSDSLHSHTPTERILKVFSPLHLYHMLLRYSLILKLIQLKMSIIKLHTISHNDKAKTLFLEIFANLLRTKTEILHFHKYSETWNLAQVHPVSIDHQLDLESTCSKLNWLDMIWKGTQPVYKVPQLTVHVRAKN